MKHHMSVEMALFLFVMVVLVLWVMTYFVPSLMHACQAGPKPSNWSHAQYLSYLKTACK